MNFYNNNVSYLLKQTPHKSKLQVIIIVLIIILSFLVLNKEVYDYKYIYVMIKKENNLLNLKTNLFAEEQEKIIKSTYLEYDNSLYSIKNINIESSDIDYNGNLYSNITFQIENSNNFKDNSYAKIKLLSNKQRLIYKIKEIII